MSISSHLCHRLVRTGIGSCHGTIQLLRHKYGCRLLYLDVFFARMGEVSHISELCSGM